MGITQNPERIYKEGDPDMPEELRELLVLILRNHLENSTNPHYTGLITRLWNSFLAHAPNEEIKSQHAKLCMQEIEHGVINARILKGLGVASVNEPIKQYLFHLSVDSWVDLNMLHALADRVGMYIGEVWEGAPYQPLRRVTGKLHREEVFHCSLGMNNLKVVCQSSQDGRDEVQDKLKTWWPAALDMFGSSKSRHSEDYVKWGIRQQGNEELRRLYIQETRPLLEEMGLTVPDDLENRRFL